MQALGCHGIKYCHMNQHFRLLCVMGKYHASHSFVKSVTHRDIISQLLADSVTRGNASVCISKRKMLSNSVSYPITVKRLLSYLSIRIIHVNSKRYRYIAVSRGINELVFFLQIDNRGLVSNISECRTTFALPVK